MSDLVTRLRASAEMLQEGSEPEVALRVAADEIERLTVETCDLTARVDLTRQERGIAEAERDEARADWKQAEANGEAFATERDQARALVARVLDSHRQPWAYGMSVTITSGPVYAAWRADIEAALVPTSLEED